jgi:hypothetical protein
MKVRDKCGRKRRGDIKDVVEMVEAWEAIEINNVSSIMTRHAA